MSRRAFRDAVRDILREEGVFRLASMDEPGVVWEYDGARWIRAFVEMAELSRRRR
jgi:hypothetical protein